MSTTPSRSPPNLARLTCPFCGRFWFRYEIAGHTSDIAEIGCRGDCRRLITFRIFQGKVHVEDFEVRSPKGWAT